MCYIKSWHRYALKYFLILKQKKNRTNATLSFIFYKIEIIKLRELLSKICFKYKWLLLLKWSKNLNKNWTDKIIYLISLTKQSYLKEGCETKQIRHNW